MPKKLKSDISGGDLLKFFETHGFVLKRTKGSHMILARYRDAEKQVLTIPDRRITPKGTLKAIMNQAEKYISIDLLQDFLYTK
jgi:predicted RNA binding protein YcfA (HicA-like mRNA interferase family)